MKKILSVILSLMLVISLVPTAFAEGEIEILSPVDGSFVSSLDEIRVQVDPSVYEVIFEFDGEIIESKLESGEVIFSASELDSFAGKHNIGIYGVMADGSLVSAKSDFTVTSDFKVSGYFNNFNEDLVYDEDNIITGLPENTTIYLSSTEEKSAYALAVEGKDGEGDTAIELVLNGTATSGWGGPYLQFVTNKTNNKYPTYIVCTEFDLKMATNDVTFADEFKTSANGSFFFPAQKQFLNTSGKVEGTDYSYKAGDWMHIKIITDFKTKEMTLYIGTDYVTTTQTAPQNGDFHVARLRLTAASAASAETARCTIDNLNIYSDYSYSGINKISAVSGDEEKAENIAVGSTQIKLLMNENLNAESITNETVTLTANGDPIEISSVEYSEDTNEIVVNISDSLPYNAEIEAVLSENIQFWDGKSVGKAAKAGIKTESDGLTFEGADFKSLGNTVMSKRQLKSGNEVSCDFKFTNNTENTNPALLVLTVSDGNRIIKVVPASVSISPGTDIYSVKTVIPEAENLTLTAIACDSFTSLKAMSDILSIK